MDFVEVALPEFRMGHSHWHLMSIEGNRRMNRDAVDTIVLNQNHIMGVHTTPS